MNVRKIGKLGQTAVVVRVTDAPWEDGFDNGVVVISVGSFNSLRGRLAGYWRDNLDDGEDVIKQIIQGLRSTNRVEPPEPAWLALVIPQFGNGQTCNLCVATAFDRRGPHAENSQRATSAIITGAGQRKYRRVSMPLLGSGDGGLDRLKVLEQELEGIISAQADGKGHEIQMVSFIVEDHEFESVADFGANFLESRSGIAKWSETLKKKGRFGRLHVLEELAGGYSGASLGICEVWDENQVRLPLSVFKIGPTLMIEQEKDLASQAVVILREYAVEVLESYQLSADVAALRMPLVGDSGTARAGLSFLKFFASSGDPNEISATLRIVFGKATRLLYSAASDEWSTPEKLLRSLEQARNNRYWSEVLGGFGLLLGISSRDVTETSHVTLKGPIPSTIENFFSTESTLAQLWETYIEIPQCPSIHGDLNPRNVVMIRNDETGTYAPRIIDFHRFGKKGPLALDFARFEAGIQVKCIEEQIAKTCELAEERHLSDYELFVNSGKPFVPWDGRSLVGVVDPEFAKAVAAISAIRQCFVETSRISNRQDYWWCLFLCLLSYLRPVYDGRLTDEQRSYAIYVASNILSRHLRT